MTDSKSPKDSSSDELFDHNHLNDSDSDFLAELDRVLASDSEPVEAAAKEQAAAVEEDIFGELEEEGEDLFDLDLDMPEQPEVETPGQGTELDLDLDAARSVAQGEDQPPAEIPSTDHLELEDWPEETPADEFDLAEDVLDLGEPALAAAAAEQAAPPEQPGPLPEAPIVEAPLAAAAVAGAALGATTTAASQPKSAETQAVETAPSAPAATTPPPTHRNESSAVWSGLAALLGLIGAGLGGTAIWQLNTQQPPVTPSTSIAAPAPATSAEQDTRTAALEQRMDQEFNRVQADITSLKADIKLRPQITPIAEPAESAEAVTALKSQISGLETQLSALEQGLEQLRSQAKQTEERVSDTETKIITVAERLASRAQAPAAPSPAAPAAATPPVKKQAPAAKPKTAVKPTKKGGWAVNLLSFRRMNRATKQLDELLAMGVDAHIESVESKGKTWHRLVVDGFTNFADAKAYAEKVREKPGLSSAWVGRN